MLLTLSLLVLPGQIRSQEATFPRPLAASTGYVEQSEREYVAPQPHLGKAVLSFFTLMAYSQTRYWLEYSKFVEDWQYRFTWKDQSKRWFSLDAWRFDSNAFSTNWTHALSGALYYNMARTHHLKALPSALFAVAGAAYWELVAEWREVVSVNDLVVTSVGGIALGEAWYRLGKSLSTRRNPLLRTLGRVVHPMLWLYDGDAVGSPGLMDGLGVDFRLTAGTWGKDPQTPGGAAVQMDLDAFVWDRSEQQERPNTPTRLGGGLTWGGEGLEQVALRAQVPWKTWILEGASGAPGGSLVLSSTFSLEQRRAVAWYDSTEYKVRHTDAGLLPQIREYRDKWLSIGGLRADLSLGDSSGEEGFVLNGWVAMGFALVNSWALHDYTCQQVLTEQEKATLFAYGYYYAGDLGWGGHLRLFHRNWTLELGGEGHQAWSFHGLDRYEGDLVSDMPVRDRRIRIWTESRIKPLGRGVGLLVRLDWILRQGRLGAVATRNVWHRVQAGIFLGG